jgi:glucose-6-phosphate 1-dehydrogenase
MQKQDNHNTVTTNKQHAPFELCSFQNKTEPCMIIILGASGDLTARKIVPSLFRLFVNKDLPDPFVILGCARTNLSDHEFREKMTKACLDSNKTDILLWKRFSKMLHYCAFDYEDANSYERLAESITSLEITCETGGNKILYFAIPPSLYRTTVELFGKTGLAAEGKNGKGWTRVVIEKPFGRDLTSAMALDRTLHNHFKEHQIFRIDHYLAKETVQNILTFRFANSFFEPLWNRNFINHVHIIAAETLGVEHRSGYYEQAGVLRDMFQNHMMQLLALTAMEPPSRFEADRVRDEKVKVYRALRPFQIGHLQDDLALGQYGAGIVNGQSVPSYRDEPGIRPDSLTPTFAMMRVFLDNWRWKGVPFYLTSGKRLEKKITEIHIQFKEAPHSMFSHILKENIIANRLILGIYPDEKISLTFQTKNPGAYMCLRSVNMDFRYHQDYSGPAMVAYEKVLLDCMLGDHMLFWRQDGVDLCWSFLTPILKGCETCADRDGALKFYEAGSWGPKDLGGMRELKGEVYFLKEGGYPNGDLL